MIKKKYVKIFSMGNRTVVFRVTSCDTNHYTTDLFDGETK